MKFWKIMLIMITIGGLSIFMIAFNPFTEKGKQKRAERKENRLERKCYKKIAAYSQAYDRYLMMKYDAEYDGLTSSIVNEDWIYVKKQCPELFDEYIIPIKTKWDSIRFIPLEKTLLEGVPENVLKYRLKYKEIDKKRTKIKVKKSEDVDISNYQNSTIMTDSIN